MNRNQFNNLVKKKTEQAAFRYLRQKQQAGKKGKYIKYEKLQISDYCWQKVRPQQKKNLKYLPLD